MDAASRQPASHRNDDDLLRRLSKRADDDELRVDERDNAFTDMVQALPLDQMMDLLREGGAALRGLVASHQQPVGDRPLGSLRVGQFDVAGMARLLQTPLSSTRRPPATPDDVARAEAAIGFALPPLLIRLYRDVADGGFGPGEGLLPLVGAGGRGGRTLVGEYESLLEASSHGYGAPWPRYLLPVATWSDGTVAVVDVRDPELPVFEVDLSDLEEHDPDDPDNEYDESDRPWEIPPSAGSLRKWLDDWLGG